MAIAVNEEKLSEDQPVIHKKRLRQRRPRKNSNGDLSVGSEESSGSATEDSSACSRRRRRRTRRSRGGNKSGSKQQCAEPSDEEKEHYVALDCEMVGIGRYGNRSAVARVTMVDWNGEAIFDEFVLPESEITDYRTHVSGITATDFQNQAALDLETCRTLVLQHLEGKILVGHALKNDLHCLGIHHSWQQTRDTAKYEPFMKVRFDDGVLWPRKLRDLVHEKLSREIQEAGKPHCPYEDAFAAMELYKKVRNKWEKVMDYKIKRTAEIAQQTSQ